MHRRVGVRYEKTDVTSRALVPIATGINWAGNNEFSVQFGAPDFTTLEGEYDYVLPSLDFAFDLHRQHQGPRQLRREHRPSGLG